MLSYIYKNERAGQVVTLFVDRNKRLVEQNQPVFPVSIVGNASGIATSLVQYSQIRSLNAN
jgi:hypothetical protein